MEPVIFCAAQRAPCSGVRSEKQQGDHSVEPEFAPYFITDTSAKHIFSDLSFVYFHHHFTLLGGRESVEPLWQWVVSILNMFNLFALAIL